MGTLAPPQPFAHWRMGWDGMGWGVTTKLHQIHVSMPALKCSVGIQRKSIMDP